MVRPDFTLIRLFIATALARDERVALDPSQFNYLKNVLRFGDGDGLLVFNGRDGEWQARFLPLGKRTGVVEVIAQARPQPAASDLWYLFAPLKHARLDYMVQKATEMGVSLLQPVITERTQATRINIERMRANVIEASEQCGVLNVPEVGEARALSALLDRWPEERTLIFCDEAEEVINPLRRLDMIAPGPMAVLVGPEGGFSPTERAVLRRIPQTIAISLGPRILRADTAAVAALTIIQSALGDWRSWEG